MKTLAVLFSMVVGGSHLGGPQEIPQVLQCTVLESSRVGEDGTLEQVSFDTGDGSPLSFTVSRADGRMIGLPKNHNEHGTTRVIEAGSGAMDFKVITTYEPFAAVQVLQVRVWEEKMPFLFTDGFDLFSGTCIGLSQDTLKSWGS